MIDLSESIKNMIVPSEEFKNNIWDNKEIWVDYYFCRKQAKRNPILIKIKQLRKELKDKK